MQLTAQEIATITGGELTGNPEVKITGVAGIKEALPGDCAFIALPKFLPALKITRASLVLLDRKLAAEFTGAIIRVDNPVQAFTQIVMRFMPPTVKYAPGIHPRAVIADTAKIGNEVCIQAGVIVEDRVTIGDRTVIGANTVIGTGCQVGDDCLLYANVTLREYTTLGHRVILHSGVVLGADGFGFEQVKGIHQKIPQVGIVEVGDDVEIGANTAIDRARFGKTRIGRGTKIDNLVQIGHNCVIGEDCIICGLVGLAGSTIIGNGVTVAGQAGLAGHLTIGDGSIIMAQAGVTKDVPPGSFMLGAPAVPHREFKRINAVIQNLPDLAARVSELEKQLALLRSRQ